MKRLLCVLIVLLALCGCGRAAPAQGPSVESVPQTQQTIPALSEPESEIPGTTNASVSVSETAAETVTSETERQLSEPATTNSAATAQAETHSDAASTKASERYTLFTYGERTAAKPTTTKPTTTKPTTTKPTTTKPAATTTTTTTTAAAPSYSPPVRNVQKTCTVTIDCRELLEHPEKLRSGKEIFVPKSGYIVRNVTVTLSGGESVFDVLRTVCAENVCSDNCRFCTEGNPRGIQMESTYTPQFDNYYVEGIHQLYEKDCGGTSGWIYYVNGVFPNVGSSAYPAHAGDRIEWVYSITQDADEGK